MGYKLYVATKHEVTWGNEIGFNYKSSEFDTLLTAMGVDHWVSEGLSEVEINRTSLEIAVKEKLRQFSQLSEDEKRVITLSLDEAEISLEETIQIFEKMLEQADPKNDLVYCSFF